MKEPSNIDDLFSRKLSNLERTPSPDLWQRIEQGQKKELRRPGGWYWYAAASVAILLMAGYMVWQSQMQKTESQGQMARREQVIKPEEEKLDSPALELNNTEALVSTQKVEPAKEDNNQRQAVKIETYLAVEKGVAVAPTQKGPQQTPILEDIKIANAKKIETNPDQLIVKTDEGANSIQPVEIKVGAPGTVLTDLPQKRIIVAHVEMENFDKNSEPSKFIRVMRQLKNAKQGEEVEWDKLGFNPKRILARADERLRNGEDKISDKYQELKNKTKL